MPINPLFMQSSSNALNQLQGGQLQQPNNFKITQPGIATFTGQPNTGININPQTMGQKALSPDSNISAPAPTLPPKMVAPNTSAIQGQLSSAQSQLGDLQAKQSALQKYGLQDVQQLTKDAGGNYVPIGSQGAGSQPYYPNKGLYGQLVTGLANTAQSNPQVQGAIKNIQDLQNEYATTFQQIQGTPGLGQQEAQGSEGLLQNLFANKMAAAQGALSNVLQEQGLQQQGLGAAAGLAQPMGAQALGFYNPVTGQFTQYGGGQGGGGAVQAGIVGGQIQAGQQSALNQALLGKITPMANNLNNLISQANINPTDQTFLNQLINWGRTNLFSDPRVPEFQGQLNDIVSSLSGILGVPSSATSDFRTRLAGAIVNGLQRGQSVSDSINYFAQQAQAANQGYTAGAAGANIGGVPPSAIQGGSDFFNQNWFQ